MSTLYLPLPLANAIADSHTVLREAGGEPTPDGKTVVYLRSRITQRIVTTDLSALLPRAAR